MTNTGRGSLLIMCVLWGWLCDMVACDVLQADKGQLTELRQYQQRVRLSDDVAADIVKEAARTRLETALDAAVEVINRRTSQRDNTEAITQASHRLQ